MNIHPTAVVDEGAMVGENTAIWHFCHVASSARIGCGCVLGQNVYIGPHVVVGSNVRIQNNVSLYEGVELEDDVFCGPSCVFTNVKNPRAQFPTRGRFEKTLVRRGATIGANATVICGTTIGAHAFVAAGAVVVTTVVDFALMMGVPARRVGWVGRHGARLSSDLRCPISGLQYEETSPHALRCVDFDP